MHTPVRRIVLFATALSTLSACDSAPADPALVLRIGNDSHVVGSYDPQTGDAELWMEAHEGLELALGDADDPSMVDPAGMARLDPELAVGEPLELLARTGDDAWPVASLQIAPADFEAPTRFRDGEDTGEVVVDGPNGSQVRVWCDANGCYMEAV